MKLKMVRMVQTQLPVALACDPYVCMDTIIGQEQVSPAPLYWRLIDETLNLITIGIDRSTGMLYSITVLYDEQIKPLEHDKQKALPVKHPGIPQFSLELWRPSPEPYDVRSDFVDVSGQCLLGLGSNSLHLTLFEDKLAYSTVYEQKIVCQFNDREELCGIVFDALLPEQMKCIKQWYG